ncbi:chemotaxis protein CheB [Actinoplanes sp. NPDC049316]|uniref:chemotaxis protein CheB n=1 Tax=Actinoplanes sp. NPDC049316 TaxID=3154727 RepID=UPI00343A848D
MCSTGGLDAVIRILEPLPAGFAAATIVLRHHDPRGKNNLAQILARRTELPVTLAHDGGVLAPARVFVAPTGYHTLVAADDTLTLIVSGERPPYHRWRRSGIREHCAPLRSAVFARL